MMSSQSTFASTQAFATIYFYTYVLISLVIILGAYQIASKVKLYYESYKFLKELESKLGNVTIAINGLEKKYDIYTKYDKKQRLNFINVAMIESFIKSNFNEMHQILDKHEQELINKVYKIRSERNKCTNIKTELNIKDTKSNAKELSVFMAAEQTEKTSNKVNNCNINSKNVDFALLAESKDNLIETAGM